MYTKTKKAEQTHFPSFLKKNLLFLITIIAITAFLCSSTLSALRSCLRTTLWTSGFRSVWKYATSCAPRTFCTPHARILDAQTLAGCGASLLCCSIYSIPSSGNFPSTRESTISTALRLIISVQHLCRGRMRWDILRLQSARGRGQSIDRQFSSLTFLNAWVFCELQFTAVQRERK